MAKSGSKGVLFTVGVLALAGVGFLAINGRSGPSDGVEGAIGAADRHQNEKSQYYQDMNEGVDITPAMAETAGTIAAKLTSAPAEAAELLREAGWTREELDEMVETIRGEEGLNRAFLTAKRKASQD